MAFQLSFGQRNAFQIPSAVAATVGDSYTYAPTYQKYQVEERQREKIRKEKSDLDKLQSVLAENERKRLLAAESKLLADAENAMRLAALEQEYLQEIDRLLVVRADLMRRVRQSEETLIMMMAMKRKRLRAVNWQAMLAM